MRRRILGWLTTGLFLWALLAPRSGPSLLCECAGRTVAHAPAATCCGDAVVDAGQGLGAGGCCRTTATPERAYLAPATVPAPAARTAGHTPCLRGPSGRPAAPRAATACS